MKMNNGQSYVVATGVVLLIILTVFMLPWRLERTGDLRWGPVYRQPITYTTKWVGPIESATYSYENADLAFGILGLELLGLGLATTGLFFALEDDAQGEGKEVILDEFV